MGGGFAADDSEFERAVSVLPRVLESFVQG